MMILPRPGVLHSKGAPMHACGHLAAVPNLQFAQDSVNIILNGRVLDPQLPRDLFIGKTFSL